MITVTCTTVAGLAILLTVFRLSYRTSTRRFGLDDACKSNEASWYSDHRGQTLTSIYAGRDGHIHGVFGHDRDCLVDTQRCTRYDIDSNRIYRASTHHSILGVGPLDEPRQTRVIAYWVMIMNFTNVLWYGSCSGFRHLYIFIRFRSARMSILFSVIRVIPPMIALRRTAYMSAILFGLMWISLHVLKAYICGRNTRWEYQTKAGQSCHVGRPDGILELASQETFYFCCFCPMTNLTWFRLHSWLHGRYNSGGSTDSAALGNQNACTSAKIIVRHFFS